MNYTKRRCECGAAETIVDTRHAKDGTLMRRYECTEGHSRTETGGTARKYHRHIRPAPTLTQWRPYPFVGQEVVL